MSTKLFYALLLSIVTISKNAPNQSINYFSSALQEIAGKDGQTKLQKLKKELQNIASKPLEVQLNNGGRKAMITAYEQECKRLQKYNTLVKPHNKTTTLRIVTYNVHMWLDPSEAKFEHERMINILKAIDADVVCLQEVTLEGQYPYTLKKLTETFNEIGYSYGGQDTFSPYHGPYFGNIIFSKYALNNITKRHYNDGHQGKGDARSFVGATIDFNGISMRIYCTHLDVYDKTGSRRQTEIKELIKHIKENDPEDASIFITGDFNDPRSQDYPEKIWQQFTKHQKDTRNEDFFDYTSYALHLAGYRDYHDAYERLGLKPPFTSWTGTIIDFGYLRDEGPLRFKDVNFYFDAASDHIAVVFDLQVA